jgi:hypothetical protein
VHRNLRESGDRTVFDGIFEQIDDTVHEVMFVSVIPDVDRGVNRVLKPNVRVIQMIFQEMNDARHHAFQGKGLEIVECDVSVVDDGEFRKNVVHEPDAVLHVLEDFLVFGRGGQDVQPHGNGGNGRT